MINDYTKYRLRRGLCGVCVLQALQDSGKWKDVNYSFAPRALVSEFTMLEEIKKLEIDNAYLEK